VSAFGELLREYRVRAGLSQFDLAEKAQISPAAVSALERGVRKAPYRSTISLLAKALNLSAEERVALGGARQAGRSKSVTSGGLHNLRDERTSFVGRAADIADIIKLVERSRLVTVTGSGGIGKTRTAIEAAKQLLGHSWDETWFIDLGSVTDGEFVVSKIAYTIQPALTTSAGSIETLSVALAKRRMFLILDNCEHVIANAAQAADTILSRCPQITILATSRERLNVAGEFVYRLPSLLLPPDVPGRIERVQEYSAIDLFIQRAQALAPHLTFDSTNLSAVVDIVRRLDGIPLAIELTAAQVPVLGIETLRDRLHQEFDVSSGRRDLPARQQTVNAAIRWSFELLTTEEQALLCDASVFGGGFTLAAAEAVCAADELSASLVLQRLSTLVDKSLVNVESVDGGVRYALLESVRAFGLHRLHEEGGYTPVARRHARWFARLAADFEDAVISHERAVSLVADIDNLRNAIAWSLNAPVADDAVFAAEILCSFAPLWDFIGRPSEHRRLLEEVIKRIDESRHPRLLSRLLTKFILHAQREPVVLQTVDRAVRLCEQFGDDRARVRLHIVLTAVLSMHGMLAEADRSAERASNLLDSAELNDPALRLSFLANRHDLRMAQCRFDEARADLAAAEAHAAALGERLWTALYCYSRYSTLEYAAGNKHLAREFAERMISSEFNTYPVVEQNALERLAMLRLDAGDLDDAKESLTNLLLRLPVGESTMHSALEIAALYLALRGRSDTAAKLLGFVQRVVHSGFRRNLMKQDAHDRLCTLLREQLGPLVLAASEAEGALMGPAEAHAIALAAVE